MRFSNFLSLPFQYLASLRLLHEFVNTCEPKKTSRYAYVVGLILMVLFVSYGVYLRTGSHLFRDLWVDELWRAQQILHAENYGELLEKKYFGMEMPVQRSEYLQGKIGLLLFGKSELAFRIWAALWGILALFLFACCAHCILSPVAAALAVFLMAGSSGLIEHGYEFKPYTLESMLTLLALSLCVYCERQQQKDTATTWTLLVLLLGILAVFSNLFVFLVFLGVIYVVREKPVSQFSRKELMVLLIGGVLLVYFALTYSEFLLSLKDNKYFRFWSPYTITSWEQTKSAFGGHMPFVLSWYVLSPLPLKGAHIIWPLLAGGMALLVGPLLMLLRRNLLVIFIAFPLAVQVALSLVGAYPMFTRVSTFFYPLLILSFAYCVDVPWRSILKRFTSPLEAALLTILIPASVYYIVQHPRNSNPGTKRHVQTVEEYLEIIASDGKFNDGLSLNYGAKLALKFYAPTLENSRVTVNLPTPKQSTPELARKQIELLSKKFAGKTVWLLATHRVAGYRHLKAAIRKRGNTLIYDKSSEGSFLLAYR